MRVVRTLFTLALLAAVATPLFAKDKKSKSDKPKEDVAYYGRIDGMLKKLKLTDDQKTKLDALKKEDEQKFKDAYAAEKVLTDEQQKAGAEAAKAAKDAGKSRDEIRAARKEASKETPEQKAKHHEAFTKLTELQKDFKGKVLDLLTADQKQELEAAQAKKKDKKDKHAKDKAATPATPPATDPAK